MKVLITGACGWVGRELTKVLAEAGHTLRLTDIADPAEATMFVPGREGRVKAPIKLDWPFVRADLCDGTAMLAACEGMDAVVHLGTVPSGLYDHGKEVMQASVVGTWVVMDAARREGVGRMCYASSVNAYGTFYWRVSGKASVYTTMPLREDEFAPVPEDPYSLGKYFNELTAASFHRAFGGKYAGFRFAGLWTEELYRQRLENPEPTKEWSDGLYQWVHYADEVAGIRKALECPTLPECDVYLLGAADTTQPESTMEILHRFRPDLVRTMKSEIAGRGALVSIDRAKVAFGYAPIHRLGV